AADLSGSGARELVRRAGELRDPGELRGDQPGVRRLGGWVGGGGGVEGRERAVRGVPLDAGGRDAGGAVLVLLRHADDGRGGRGVAGWAGAGREHVHVVLLVSRELAAVPVACGG